MFKRATGQLFGAVQVSDGSDGGSSSSRTSSSSDDSSIVFVSLLQNLITRETGSNDEDDGLPADGVIFTTD